MSTTNPTDIPTEWEELQIKYGNYAPRPPVITNEILSNTAIDFAEGKDVLSNKTLEQLKNLEDSIEEDELEKYRKMRLAEMKQDKLKYKFGELYHVGKADYVNEITEASKGPDNPFVILHMYTESNPICVLLNRALVIIARKHGYVKFTKAIGTDVVSDLPESRIPTVLVYKAGKCLHQLIGTSIWGGENLNVNCVEWVLWKNKVLDFAAEEDDPRQINTKRNSSTKSRIRYTDVSPHDHSSEEEEESEHEINQDRRGYSSLALEKALRLK